MNKSAVVTVAVIAAAALSGCSSPAPEIASPCDPGRIERDLGVSEHLVAGTPTLPECNGDWAVIRWDVPGDNQRIVQRVDSTWTDYVLFPHDRCWSEAEADGVPGAFEPYFLGC